MSEFKVGDKVRLIGNPNGDQTIGDVGFIHKNQEGDYIGVNWGLGRDDYIENIKDIELLEEEKVLNTLIKTETKIKSGVYGLLELFSHDDHEVTIELRYTTAQAKELREAANVLNEIATILEGQNK